MANRAGAYLKMGRWRDCRRDCARVVAAAARGSDLHLRACLRRAVASEKLGGAEALRAGLADLDVLLKYQPGHPEAVRLRAAVEEALGGLGPDAPPPAPVEDPVGAAVAACEEVVRDAAAAAPPPPPPAEATNFDILE